MKTSYTNYKEVYDVFLGRITDHGFLQLPEEDVEELCLTYLKRAVPQFTKCKTDLSSRNDVLGYFNTTLAELEIQILGVMMTTEWLTPQIYNITVIKQFLGDSEYKHFSQANHLDKLMKLKDKSEEDSDRLITLYTNDFMEFLND